MKIAVIGATGVVGRKILEVMQEREFPASLLIPAASARSAGETITWRGRQTEVMTIKQALDKKPDIALFSAGSEVSGTWAPLFASQGCKVIDNSSRWRTTEGIKLIVPEVNGNILRPEDMIIANPNCSTIQMVVALNLLHRTFKIKRIVVSTYQSVSGSGHKGISQLTQERNNQQISPEDKAYEWPIDLNVIPQIGDPSTNGYTSEEMKMVNETQKIFDDYNIMVSPTTVRVPVTGGHSESINAEFHRDFEIEEVTELILRTPGVKLISDHDKPSCPMPLYCKEHDSVFAGRIRKDLSNPRALNMWVVADNLRKGAATNAVQIAQLLLKNA
jgi:aspartate-semialdehyde dehydrogenase